MLSASFRTKTSFLALILETFLRSKLGQELLAQGIFSSVIDEITPEHIPNMVISANSGDKDKYAEVVELQREANIARQKAINLMLSARNLLEEKPRWGDRKG